MAAGAKAIPVNAADMSAEVCHLLLHRDVRIVNCVPEGVHLSPCRHTYPPDELNEMERGDAAVAEYTCAAPSRARRVWSQCSARSHGAEPTAHSERDGLSETCTARTTVTRANTLWRPREPVPTISQSRAMHLVRLKSPLDSTPPLCAEVDGFWFFASLARCAVLDLPAPMVCKTPPP
jgi:hypothetical protein